MPDKCLACGHDDPHDTLRGGHWQCAGCHDAYCENTRGRPICTNKDQDLAAALAELDELRECVDTWICERCNMAYTTKMVSRERRSLPACPVCGFHVVPKDVIELRKARAEIERLLREDKELRTDKETLMTAVSAVNAENERLERWKKEIMEVEAQWDRQAVARELGIPLGETIADKILPAIQTMKAENERLKAEIERLQSNLNEALRRLHSAEAGVILSQHPLGQTQRERILALALTEAWAENERLKELTEQRIFNATPEELEALCRLEGRSPDDVATICKQVAKIAVLQYKYDSTRNARRIERAAKHPSALLIEGTTDGRISVKDRVEGWSSLEHFEFRHNLPDIDEEEP